MWNDLQLRKRFAITAAAVAWTMAAAALNSFAESGYIAGRSDAKYGTYNTALQPSARAYQKRLLDLENEAYGLAKISQADPVLQSEEEFLLESKIVRLNLDIANAPENSMTPFERDSLLFGSVRAFETVRQNGERLFENMIRYIDIKIPGPNGQQIRSEVEDGEDSIYAPNYRSDQDLTEKDRATQYETFLHKFLSEGGSLSEIQLLSPTVLNKMGAYTRVEYAWLPSGELWVTEGKAGHVLLAKGKEVKSAGQIFFLKSDSGRFSMIVVSNSSGNYKPDLLSAKKLTTELQKMTGISPELISVTKGEPMSSQAVKIYLKADGVAPDVIRTKVNQVEEKSRAILSPPNLELPFRQCAGVFS